MNEAPKQVPPILLQKVGEHYPFKYTDSSSTDIRKLFDRIRAELAAQKSNVSKFAKRK